MNYRLVFFSLVLFAICQTYSQTTIPADIVSLSELTYDKSPIIKRNTLTITNAEGNLQIQKSTFDYQLSSDVSLSRNSLNLFEADPRNEFIDNELNSRSTGASIGLFKTFRSSLSANLSVNYTMANDNFPFNSFSQNVGTYIQDHAISSTFSLTQPLLRGRGKSIATALEEASALNLQSTNNNVDFANSFEVLQTGIAYWQYVAAFKSLKIFEENEARVRRVLEITQELVKADKKPAGDLAQIQADLANQERQTNVAQRVLYGARLNLGRVIGLSEESSKNIGDPLNEFPTILESGYIKGVDINTLIDLARTNRDDLKAVEKSQQSIELQLNVADNNLKPQLDLTGFVNYGGMTMGNGLDRALASFSQTEGRNLGFGLRMSFTFPINNNLAKGSYLQNEAALMDQDIANKNLQRNISLNVSIAQNNLDNSVLILEKAKESLDFYQQVYENERVKFQNGLTTLLNLILFQERLTFAQLDYLQAHQQFASAIVNLRYETGTLLVVNADDTTKSITAIDRTLFYTIPNNN